MAKPRVVVEGLKGAIQQVRPTVPGSYGTTPVNVIQTPSWQEGKLGQLARAVGVGVQIAGEVKQIGDIKEQEAISDLADKSIEEVNAEALQNRNEFDKLNRKQFIPFMSNPWNQERVRKAAGAQFHDEFQLRLQQALDKSDAATPTDKVVQDVITGMTEEYESLKDITIRQGFDAATKSTIQQYSLRYNSIKNEQNENELFRGGRSVLFNASTLVNGEIADPEAITNWWEENEGALKPAKLKKLRDDVVLLHASRGNFEAARAFQEYTSNLKAGTTKMGDPDIKEDDVFGMYSAEEAALRQKIDDMEVSSDARLVADAKKQLREYDELAVDIGLAIRTKEGYTTEDGIVIKNKEEAEAYLLKQLQTSNNIMVRGSDGVALVQNALKRLEMPSDENYILFKENYARAFSGPQSFRFRYEQVINDFNQQVGVADFQSGKLNVDPRYTKLSNNLLVDMARKRDAKQLEISTGTFTDVNGEVVTTSKFQEQMQYMKAWDDLYLKEYDSQLKEQYEELAPKVELTEESKRLIAEDKSDESFTMPGEKMSDLYGFGATGTIRKAKYFTGRGDFTDLEKLMRDGLDYKEFVDDLEEEQLGSTLSVLQSTEATPEEQQTAKNKIALYTLAKGLYTADNIRNGTVSITYGGKPAQTVETTYKEAVKKGYTDITRTGFAGVGAIVKIPAVDATTREINIDKPALKRLVNVFPLITKKRLIEISETEPEDFPDELELYEAIYDVELDPESFEDADLLKAFIRKQAELSQRIYKK